MYVSFEEKNIRPSNAIEKHANFLLNNLTSFDFSLYLLTIQRNLISKFEVILSILLSKMILENDHLKIYVFTSNPKDSPLSPLHTFLYNSLVILKIFVNANKLLWGSCKRKGFICCLTPIQLYL